MVSPGPDQQRLLQLGLRVKLTCPELKDYHTQRQLSSGAGVICEINVLDQHISTWWSVVASRVSKKEKPLHTHTHIFVCVRELMNKLKLKVVYLQCITIGITIKCN